MDWVCVEVDCIMGMSCFACPECGDVKLVGGISLSPVPCEHPKSNNRKEEQLKMGIKFLTRGIGK